MNPGPRTAALWQSPAPDAHRRLEAALDEGLARAGRCQVFFRADDVAVPGARLAGLLGLFCELRAPLSPAVVPAWLTPARWRAIKNMTGGQDGLFAWHQHGWRHANHEPAGKKQEFGPAREAAAKRRDLAKGRDKLGKLIGKKLVPAFTPPWNRMDGPTLWLLPKLDFKVVSRSVGAKPPAPGGLAEFPVAVDLHTRKESDPDLAWEGLWAELENGLASGLCGIMIHHQLMNQPALAFMGVLLGALSARREVDLVHLGHLTGESGAL